MTIKVDIPSLKKGDSKALRCWLGDLSKKSVFPWVSIVLIGKTYREKNKNFLLRKSTIQYSRSYKKEQIQLRRSEIIE